jgi:hypothetical protein
MANLCKISEEVKVSKLGKGLLITTALVLFSILMVACGPEREPEILVFAAAISSEEPLEKPYEFIAIEEDTVSIFVDSYEDTTFHIHGYDLIKEVKANVPEVFIFTATATGRFEIVTHSSAEHHGSHNHSSNTKGDNHGHNEKEKVVAILEVRPR